MQAWYKVHRETSIEPTASGEGCGSLHQSEQKRNFSHNGLTGKAGCWLAGSGIGFEKIWAATSGHFALYNRNVRRAKAEQGR